MSLAWAMATQIAAPTTTEETMVETSPRPEATRIRIVTAIRVMPLSGDQLVRPTHSATITPAAQIHRVPSTAIEIAWPKVMFGAAKKAMATSASPPKMIAP